MDTLANGRNKDLFRELLFTHEYYCTDNFYQLYLLECVIRGIPYCDTAKEISKIFMASGTGCPAVALQALSASQLLDDELKAWILIFIIKSKTFPGMFSQDIGDDKIFNSYLYTIKSEIFNSSVYEHFGNILYELNSAFTKDHAIRAVELFKLWINDPLKIGISELIEVYNAGMIGNTVIQNLIDSFINVQDSTSIQNIDFTNRMPTGSLHELLAAACIFLYKESKSEIGGIKIPLILKAIVDADIKNITITYIDNSNKVSTKEQTVSINGYIRRKIAKMHERVALSGRDILLDGKLLYSRGQVPLANPETERYNVCKIISEKICPLFQ